MSLSARQITLSDSAATPLLVEGITGTEFRNIEGSLQDPLPLLLQNLDNTIDIWIGGEDVSTTKGWLLVPGASIPMQLFGSSEIPYAIAASGTPVIAVLVGRQ